MRRFATACVTGLLGFILAAPLLAQDRDYRVLATSKTSTMQKEMQEAGDAGYRFVAVMGGETAIGGNEVVVLMEKSKEATTYSYRLLSANRTSTLQKELQQAADAGYAVVGQTVFESAFGGKETAALLEKSGDGSGARFDYKLLATSKTSTMEKELRELAELGYQAVGLTVGKTAIGGSELVVIARKQK